MNRGTNTNQPAPEQAARIMFLAFQGGVIMFLVVAVFLNQTMGAVVPSTQLMQILSGATIVLAVSSLPFAMLVRRRAAGRPPAQAVGKMIASLAILEFPALLGVVTFLLTGAFAPAAVVSIVLVAAMWWMYPFGKLPSAPTGTTSENPYAELTDER